MILPIHIYIASICLVIGYLFGKYLERGRQYLITRKTLLTLSRLSDEKARLLIEKMMEDYR